MIIIILKTIAIGIGATLAIDIWVSLLKLFKIKSLDYRYVGRWIGNIPKRKFFHNKIQDAPQIPHELILGWLVHYLIGITFAFILVAVYGISWLDKPSFFPAIIIGLITAAGPFFIMQRIGFGPFLSCSLHLDLELHHQNYLTQIYSDLKAWVHI